MCKKIFFGNYKGGVGKTTSTYHVALSMANVGKKVLLIDLDSQSSLSEVCISAYNQQFESDGEKIIFDNLQHNEVLNYVYDIYIQSQRIKNINVKIDKNKLIKNVREGVDFIPNSLFYKNGGLDKITMNMENTLDNLLILRNFIEDSKINEDYDFIFFDCPPSNNIITQSSFLYSDYYIIPTIMDTLSVRGVKHYISVVEGIYDEYCNKNENSELLKLIFGEKPILLGVFQTMRKANSNVSEHKSKVSSYEDASIHLFNSEIKDRKNVSDSTGIGKELSSNNQEYKDLTDEILNRIKQLV